MNLFSWNCRGLGLPRTVQELVALVRAKSPMLVFLSETRTKGRRVENLRWRLGLKNCITVDSVRSGGGLALFWHESVDVSLIEMHQRYIDVHVRESPSEPRTRVTFVYGEPRTDQRHIMWELLRRLRGRSMEPWLAIGDFNEAMWGYEHFSACPRPERQMVAFRDALADCELTDLGFTGLPYTYDNGRGENANVKVRLDRAVACPEWRDLFGDAVLHHLVSSRSDHCPLFLEIKKES
jgi:exonuclease III